MPADVVAQDDCDAVIDVVYNEVRVDGDCANNYTLTRTWTATDDCNNTATATQIITVIDNTAPDILNAPADITVECDEVPAAPADVVAQDDCDALIDVVYNEVRVDGDCANNYTLTRTWTATDDCNNTATATQIITVIDNTAPDILNAPADITVECDEVPAAPADVVAQDDCDALIDVVYNEVRVDGDCANNYTLTRTWTATDDCNNTATATQIITVIDNTAPDILNAPADITVECDEVPAAPADVVAQDDCDALIDVVYNEVRVDGDCANNYTLTRTWTATDDCNNTATATQIITVIDNTAPDILNAPATQTITMK